MNLKSKTHHPLRRRPLALAVLAALAGPAAADTLVCTTAITGQVTATSQTLAQDCQVANTGAVTAPHGVFVENTASFTNSGAVSLAGTWRNEAGQFTNIDGATLSLATQLTASPVFENWPHALLANRTGSLIEVRGFGAYLLNFDSATLENDGDNSRLNVGSEGTLANGGTLLNSNGAMLEVNDGGKASNETSLENNSTLTNRDAYVVLSGANAALYNQHGATLSNEAGGSFFIEKRAGLVQRDASTFVNRGSGATGRQSMLVITGGSSLELDGSGAAPGTNLLRNEDGALLHNAGNLVLKHGALLENGASLSNSQNVDVWTSTLHNLLGGDLENGGTLVLEQGATLLNDGRITDDGTIHITRDSRLTNVGTLTVTGSIESNGGTADGPGELVNRGQLIIADGGAVTARIAASAADADVRNGTLVHGSWQFQTSSGHVAALTLLDAAGAAVAIDTLGAQSVVRFSGDGRAAFAGLTDHLRAISGALSIGTGYAFDVNTSRLTLTKTGLVDVDGTFRVGAGHALTLAGGGQLYVRDAGRLEIAGEADGTGDLFNIGTVRVLAGGSASLHPAGFAGGTLTSGRWAIVGDTAPAALSLLDGQGGTPDIDTIGTGAEVNLSGAGAHFDQLTRALRQIDGTLEIGAGYEYATGRALRNDGTIDNAGGLTVSANTATVGTGLVVNEAAGHVLVDGQFAGRIENHGLVSVGGHGAATINGADVFDAPTHTLQTGAWEILADGPFAGQLRFDTSVDVLGADAALILHGPNATTPGNALHANFGTLSLLDGLNYTPSGSFDNEGTLVVGAGSAATLANSANFGVVNGRGTLRGGYWQVLGGPSTELADRAVLTLQGGAPIAVLDTNSHVLLSGAGSRFDQLESALRDVKGELEIAGGRSFQPGQTISNEGTIAALEGGTIALGRTTNLGGQTLTGGHWIVDAGAGTAVLAVADSNGATNAITTLAANTFVSLSGAGAQFDQLTQNLATNGGTLEIGGGYRYLVDRAFRNDGVLATLAGGTLAVDRVLVSGPNGRLSNVGSLEILDGGNATFTLVDELALDGKGNGTLTAGRWNVSATVDPASLVLGAGDAITAIGANAAVRLSGAGAHFDQLESGLAEVDGTLEITDRTFASTQGLVNHGTVRAGTGAGVQIAQQGLANPNLAGGVLSGGNWEIVAGAGEASLEVGGGPITTLAANTSVLVSGKGALFKQLEHTITTNQGTLTVADGRSFALGDGFTNQGSLVAGSGGSFVVGGTLNLGAGTLTVDGDLTAGQTDLTGGTLGGDGTLHGALVLDGGTIAPGHSPGLLTIDGPLTMNAGTLAIQIGGLARGTEYDALDATTVTLGGTLDVCLYDLGAGLFQPQVGQYFDIVGAEQLSGDFTSFVFEGLAGNVGWSHEIVAAGQREFYRLTVVPRSTGGSGDHTAVPVPPAWLLFASAGVLLRRRR